MPDLVDGRSPGTKGTAMAWSTLVSARLSLDHSLTFHYPQWTLSKHGNKRVDALFLQLEKDGRVTRVPTLEKQWISAMLVRQMVTALLRKAIADGTRSWDAVIHKCLSLVLQAATCARAGDIVQSDSYSDPVHLQWKHVKVKFMGTVEKPDMRMLVKMFFTKGHK